MEVKLKNVNNASKIKSAGLKRKTLVSCLLSSVLIICLLISPAAATLEWKISPFNPVVGDTLKITGKAAPGSSVRAEVTYVKVLPVSGGQYQLSLKNIKVPEGSDNLFSVRAEGVQDLHVGVKKFVWFNLNAAATNGVATISQGHVPSWTYDILIDGNAAKGQKSVVLYIKASQTLKADSKGNLAFNYETSSMPVGEFKIKIGNSEKTIELRDKWQKKPVADFSAAEVSWKMPLQVKFTDKSSGNPKGWYWDFGDKKTSTEKNPVHTYKKAGRYTVSLTVWNEAGKSTIKKTYDIHVYSHLEPHHGHSH